MIRHHSSGPTSGPSARNWCSTWRRRFKIIGGLVAVVLGVFLLYALSFGPAMARNQRGELPVEVLEKFYLPLAIVSDMTGTQRWLERYVALWVSPDPAR